MAVYRITYSIERALSDDDEFVEIGFGSSVTGHDVDSCAYDVESDVQRGSWETSGDMPEPREVQAEIAAWWESQRSDTR